MFTCVREAQTRVEALSVKLDKGERRPQRIVCDDGSHHRGVRGEARCGGRAPDRHPNVLNAVKVGDNVQVTYTEALVIDVVTPKM